ncbi:MULTISPECIES: DUF1996 domain-containing protein [Streptomyces]|uniref:DUF1996 domain-containing protein n=1 Tax=Streptomyces TaxID=1883 RepID=UPI00292E7453|nr:DUF1996 domain-containing protein [Streptomyces sp. NEAU-HV9]
MAANVYASATESGSDQSSQTGRVLAAGATIDCPDVGSRLTDVPDGAREDVDKQLALLDQQVAAAYQQLQQWGQSQQQNSGSADDAIMNPLKDKRAEAIGQISDAIDQVGDRPQGLDDMAACTLQPSGNQSQGGGSTGQGAASQNPADGGQGQNGGGQGNGGQAGNGPVAADYADITSVQPNVQTPAPQSDASRGSFSSSCGVNANGVFNSDNVIVAPGVSNGAHHFHDYVGNQDNNAFASDDDLANGDTSCADKGDRSTYYWPVLRLQNGKQERDAGAPGGGTEGNAGQIVTPKQVTLTFVGNPRSKVTAMPRLLRIITGDAKSFVNGPANANASWSCTGFEDRQLKDKYPLCPSGSDVVRSFKFQSCWDGRNIDSANHRTHVAFADAEGNCPNGFQAIPQLVQRIVYDVDAPSLQDGGRTVPLFAVDSFPEQLHKPVTDHGDFINVFDEDLMKQMVDCINSGRTCGAGADPGEDPSGNPSEPPASSPASPGNGEEPAPGDTATEQPSQAPADPPSAEPTDDGTTSAPASELPQVYSSSSPTHVTSDKGHSGKGGSRNSGSGKGGSDKTDSGTSGSDQGGSGNSGSDKGGSGQGGGRTTQPAEIGEAAQTPAAGANDPSAAAVQTQPQAQGGLAETGANLWPAGIGALLVIAGFVVLRRMGGRSV